tara:strand:+ start:504 stop:1715 length:1212 start_codon:yes stop_codon:yes gene_type:complete
MKIEIPTDLRVRDTYLNRILPFVDKQLIKVLIGQRRVGKSYLLFQLINYLQTKNNSAHFIYINKEDLAFSFIKTANDLESYILEKKSETSKTYVFIDEIQEIENFEVALRSLLLNSDLDIYCTGSNADLLSSDLSGKLSGRCIELVVYSLSYLEFLDFHELENNQKALNSYLKYGGLPYLKNLELKDEIVFDYLKNIYSSIVYRDIVNRYSLRNSTFLEQLILFLASTTGSIFSAKKISDFLKSQQIKMAPNQVQNHIKQIVNAFIIHKVSRYDLIGKRIFEIGEKYYFENIGIRNGIWGFRLENMGKIIENIVYNHLVYKGYNVKVGILNSYEIDFIAQKSGEKAYFQVALSITDQKTIEREFGNLKKIKDNYSKTVISMDGFDGNTFEGIKHIDLRSFLSE